MTVAAGYLLGNPPHWKRNREDQGEEKDAEWRMAEESFVFLLKPQKKSFSFFRLSQAGNSSVC